eukprot:8285125-Pyramimonas_sp.AAC.2
MRLSLDSGAHSRVALQQSSGRVKCSATFVPRAKIELVRITAVIGESGSSRKTLTFPGTSLRVIVPTTIKAR